MVNMDEWRPRPFPPNTTARRRALRAPDAAVHGTLCAWAMQHEIVKAAGVPHAVIIPPLEDDLSDRPEQPSRAAGGVSHECGLVPPVPGIYTLGFKFPAPCPASV